MLAPSVAGPQRCCRLLGPEDSFSPRRRRIYCRLRRLRRRAVIVVLVVLVLAMVVILGLPSPIEIALELVLGSAGYEVRCCRDDMDASVTHHELKGADVLLVGRSQPGAVTANWVRDGCIILDLGLFSCAPPKRVEVCEKQRDVVALCCRDGLAAITAALRMRNASHCSLLNQGFLDVQKSTGFFEDTGDW